VLAIVLAVVVTGTSACSSNPSPTRVAEDLVQTLASTPEEEECMMDVIEDYDLNQLGDDAGSDNAEIAAQANEQLDQFEADLAACR
jgi:uncharacterized lipoprotein